MKCNNCGKELVEGNLFCDECGTKVESQSVNSINDVSTNQDQVSNIKLPMPPKNNARLKIVAIIMAIIILIGIGVGIWYFVLRDNEDNSNSNTNVNSNTISNTNTNTNTNITPTPINNYDIVCTMNDPDDELLMEEKLNASLSDGTILNVKAELIFNDKDTAEEYFSYVTLYDQLVGSESEKINSSLNDNTIVINNYENMLITGDEKNEDEIETIDLKTMTKDEFIDFMEESGFKCN